MADVPDPNDFTGLGGVGLGGNYALDDPAAKKKVPPIDWQLAKRRLATALQQIAQGGTFDTADEIGGAAAGLKSLITGGGFDKGYGDYVDWAREAQGRGEAENPQLAQVAHTAGGFLPVGASAGRGFQKLMEAGRPLYEKALGALATSGVYGAGQGAIQGAGAAEGGPEERLQGAQEGAWNGLIWGIPYGLLGLKGARGRRTTPTPAHEVPVSMRDAAEMHTAGVDPDTIAQKTGWARDADGKWRPTLQGSLA